MTIPKNLHEKNHRNASVQQMLLKKKDIIGKILLLTILISLPVFIEGIHQGHDFNFHLMRIEGIAEALRAGDLPVRMQSLWMEGYGYPVSIYYGDIFLYFPALLRILGISVVNAYKLYILAVNFGTVVLAYLSFSKLFRTQWIAELTTLAYATAAYRFVNVYVRASVGEYSAMMFFPVIALAVYRIYTADVQDWKQYRKNALILAIGMSGIIMTHTLSAEMAAVVLSLICVILLKKTFRINTIKVYVLAVIETLLLCAFFIVPFLDYYGNVDVNINNIVRNTLMQIEAEGVYAAQYFAFFQNAFGWSSYVISSRMQFTPGIVLMTAWIAAIALLIKKKAKKETIVLLVLSSAALWLASDLFPWNRLELFGIGKLFVQIQFPWRYVGIAVICLTVLLGNLLTQAPAAKRKQIQQACALVCVFMAFYFLSNYCDDAAVVKWAEQEELDLYGVAGGEYLPIGQSYASCQELKQDILTENMTQTELVQRDGCKMVLSCKTENTDGTVTVPIFYYKGYHAYDDSGNEYNITAGENQAITVTVPANYNGTVTIDFVEPIYWRLAELLSLLAWISLLVLGWRRYRKRKPIDSNTSVDIEQRGQR